jgi:hypothetical protein
MWTKFGPSVPEVACYPTIEKHIEGAIMKTLLIASIMFSGLAHAARDPQVSNAFKFIVNVENQGNGTFSSGTYNLKLFSIDRAIASLKKKNALDDTDCKRVLTVGRDANLEILKKNKWTHFPEVTAKLEALQRAGKLMAIISNNWDGKSGSSEYCARFDFYVYAKDGQKLVLAMDSRD